VGGGTINQGDIKARQGGPAGLKEGASEEVKGQGSLGTQSPQRPGH